MLQAGRLNLAQCHLKTDKWIEARAVCDKVVLEADLLAMFDNAILYNTSP